jgi:hypothetical protein
MFVIFRVDIDENGDTVFNYESVSFRLDYAIDFVYNDKKHAKNIKIYKRPITQTEYEYERKIIIQDIIVFCKRTECPQYFSGYCIEEVPAVDFNFKELQI